jgi:NAD(P)-dependent dehydrogenase (short-subunit alcohol dehydrogenase family)
VRLQNKIALITGAGRGIGRAIAQAYAREGARVALAARTAAEIEAAAAELNEQAPAWDGPRALAVPCDVTIEDQVKAAVQAALDQFGRVDVLVNNAGIATARPVWGTHLSLFERTLAVNLTGTFLFTKHAWKPMKAAGGGSIINISSLGGRRGYPLLSAYCASKWGQVGFTLACAEEGKADNIRVNALAPGKGDTGMRANVLEDKTKMLKAEDHAGACIFLASDEARYITGQVLEIEWFGSG